MLACCSANNGSSSLQDSRYNDSINLRDWVLFGSSQEFWECARRDRYASYTDIVFYGNRLAFQDFDFRGSALDLRPVTPSIQRILLF